MLLLGALLALPACRAPAPRATTPDRAAPVPDVHEPVDASYDWHGLLIAPFGSVLKDIPATLHEVLLFRDEAHGSAAGEDAECYAANGPAPRFVGRTPDEYLLCFKHDRLSRVQASVSLAAGEAQGVFTAACAGWLKNAKPASAGGATQAGAAAQPGAAAQSDAAARTNAATQAGGATQAGADARFQPLISRQVGPIRIPARQTAQERKIATGNSREA